MLSDTHKPLACIFCGWDEPSAVGDQTHTWIECPRCSAHGPHVERTMAKSDAQAIAGWNKPHSRIGEVAVASVPAGIPGNTMSLAMRLNLIAEGMRRGEYGGPDGALLLLREQLGTQAHVRIVNHNVSASAAQAILRAATNSTDARQRIQLPRARG